MKLNRRFPPLEAGGTYKVGYVDKDVMGVNFRIADARAFCRKGIHKLEFVLEPSNPFDPNAIRVEGLLMEGEEGDTREVPVHLGYVPRQVALRLADRGLVDVARPLLRHIWWGGYSRDVIYIRFDVLLPTAKAIKELGAKLHKNPIGKYSPPPEVPVVVKPSPWEAFVRNAEATLLRSWEIGWLVSRTVTKPVRILATRVASDTLAGKGVSTVGYLVRTVALVALIGLGLIGLVEVYRFFK